MENEDLGQPIVDPGTSIPIDTIGIDLGLNEFKHSNGKIFGKFDDHRALGEGYRNIEKEYSKVKQELGQFKQSAPEKYMFTLDDDIKESFSFDENHPDYQKLVPVLKELNLPQSTANKLANAYARMQVERSSVDLEAELKQLGGVGGEVIQNLTGLASKMNEQELEVLDTMVLNKDQALVLNKIINSARNNALSIPMNSQTGVEPVKGKQEYLEEAFRYKKENEATIGYSKEQQDHYMKLMTLASSVK